MISTGNLALATAGGKAVSINNKMLVLLKQILKKLITMLNW